MYVRNNVECVSLACEEEVLQTQEFRKYYACGYSQTILLYIWMEYINIYTNREKIYAIRCTLKKCP